MADVEAHCRELSDSERVDERYSGRDGPLQRFTRVEVCSLASFRTCFGLFCSAKSISEISNLLLRG